MKNDVLESIGLNKNEVLIYRTLLGHGEMIASDISKESGLTRTNTYMILKSLTGKSVVEEIDRKKKLIYRLAPPQKLVEWAEIKKREQEDNLRELYAFMPILSGAYNLSLNKPGIKYFEGIEGFKLIYDDILKQQGEVLIMASEFDRSRKEINNFLDEHIIKQASLGIKVRALIPKEDYVNLNYIEEAKNLLVQVRILPLEIFSLHSQILIYSDKEVLSSFKNQLISTSIYNKDIAQTFKVIFGLLWDKSLSEHVEILKQVASG